MNKFNKSNKNKGKNKDLDKRVFNIYVESVVNNILPTDYKSSFFLSEEINTPLYSFNNNIHNFYIGNTLEFNNLLDHELKAVIYKLLSFALFSSDLNNIYNECNERKLPFNLFLLFETIRTQNKFMEYLNYSFNWHNHSFYKDFNSKNKSFINILKSFEIYNGLSDLNPYIEYIKNINFSTKVTDNLESNVTIPFPKSFIDTESNEPITNIKVLNYKLYGKTLNGNGIENYIKPIESKYIYGPTTPTDKFTYNDFSFNTNEINIDFIGFEIKTILIKGNKEKVILPIFSCCGEIYTNDKAENLLNQILYREGITSISFLNVVEMTYSQKCSFKTNNQLNEYVNRNLYPHGTITLQGKVNNKYVLISFISFYHKSFPSNRFIIKKGNNHTENLMNYRINLCSTYYNKLLSLKDSAETLLLLEKFINEYKLYFENFNPETLVNAINNSLNSNNSDKKLEEENKIDYILHRDLLDINKSLKLFDYLSSNKLLENIEYESIEEIEENIQLNRENTATYNFSKNPGIKFTLDTAETYNLLRSKDKMNNLSFNRLEINKYASQLERILFNRFEKVNTDIPNRRIDSRRYSLDFNNIFSNTIDNLKGNDSFFIIFDCSASMGPNSFNLTMDESYIKNGFILLLILNLLAKRNLIYGKVAFTNNKGYLLLDLPVDEDIINRINTYGGEGFEFTVKENIEYIKKMNKVFFFTDGHYDFNSSILDTLRLKNKIYAMYVGSIDKLPFLESKFSNVLLASSIHELVLKILKSILKNNN